MVFTLHRYIFFDLIKKFFLALTVLSLVMGLGMMLKPLRSFNIDPMKVPQLVAYSLPITITMVLPIAALLATTLTYGRLAFDNEINACRSSGISVVSLIYPAGTLALLIGLASLLLGFHSIPYFISRFENIISEDAEAMIFRGIEKKGHLSNMFPGLVIHADYVQPQENLLYGVTLLVTDKDKVETVFTAKCVKLQVEKDATTGENFMQMKLVDAKTLVDGGFGQSGVLEPSYPIPSVFRDKIKFKNLDELKEISSNLISFSPIRQEYKEVIDQLTLESLFDYTNEILSEKGIISFACGNGYIVNISANSCVAPDIKQKKSSYNADIISNSGIVKVLYYDPVDQTRRKSYVCEKAILKKEELSSRIVLEMITAKQVNSSGVPPMHVSYLITDIIIPKQVALQADEFSVNDFVKEPVMPDFASEKLSKGAKRLHDKCKSLLVEIAAEKHSRLAFGVSCIVLTLMGTALGIVFKSGHLLTAFGISFVPAAFCLITLFTGKHIAENSSDLSGGLIFMWSGIGLVSILNLFLYRGLTRT